MQRGLSVLLEVNMLHIGGPSSWVCDIAPALKKRGVKVTVISFETMAPTDLVLPQRLEAEGIEIRRVAVRGGRWDRHRVIQAAFKAAGHNDVAHFNSDAYSGPFMPSARRCGIPVRIIHARTPNWAPSGPSLRVKLRYHWYWWLSLHHCTHAFGVTQEALNAMLRSTGRRAIPCLVVPSAIAFARFGRHAGLRARQDGVKGKSALVVGFVGRLSPMKNLDFLVRVLTVLRARGVEAHLLLMGSGPAEVGVRDLAAQENLADRVEFLPPGGNVAEVMAQRMDILALPSDFEGTPRVVIEAQATGVPALCSMAVSNSVCVVPELFHRLPLGAGPEAWAGETLHIAKIRVPRQRVEECFARSPLEIENQAERLIELYCSYLPSHNGRERMSRGETPTASQ
jgi:glycosyltransferase involved in cell wall biosynthesis